ncbi:MAG: TIGR00282 family metallophosphoesterase [Candidatus Doudnabacteria bacterium]|nr:TIGR00282 family metallophosphoesterase [Candidatus Doudnabacteria bacterium]
MPKILFIGDIVGKGGRKILREVLPQWRKKYNPDAVIVNVENMAHGKGVTPSTLAELDDLDIDCYTSGNHIFNKDAAGCFEKYNKLIRPLNYEFLLDKANQKQQAPGHGYYRFSKKGRQYLVINLNGQVFMEKQFNGGIANPFFALDGVLTQEGQKGDIIIVDFHSEATSEKIAFGYYADGRVTGVFGTHTHVPTADARILPGGTAYISDVGMTGPRDGVIGVKKESVLRKFLHPEEKFKNEVEEDGVLQINGVLIEITGNDSRATSVEKLYQEI